MTNAEREQIIQIALRDYKYAIQSGNKKKIEIAINDMENAYVAVCLWGVQGSGELRQTILKAKESLK